MRIYIPFFCLILGSVWLTNPALATTEEPIAVIMAAGHAKTLKKEDLVLIFKRKKLFWNDGNKIQAVNLPASNPLRRVFSAMVLGATPEELEKYWNDMYFHGISPPYVVSSEEAVLRFVADTPGALGYVSLCNADSRVVIALIISPAGHISDTLPSFTCVR